MAFGMVSLEKRLSNNIKNYSLDQLFQINELSDYMEAAAHVSGLSFPVSYTHLE